jgi:hypothetical protein
MRSHECSVLQCNMYGCISIWPSCSHRFATAHPDTGDSYRTRAPRQSGASYCTPTPGCARPRPPGGGGRGRTPVPYLGPYIPSATVNRQPCGRTVYSLGLASLCGWMRDVAWKVSCGLRLVAASGRGSRDSCNGIVWRRAVRRLPCHFPAPRSWSRLLAPPPAAHMHAMNWPKTCAMHRWQ